MLFVFIFTALAEVLSLKDSNGIRKFYVHYIDCKHITESETLF